MNHNALVIFDTDSLYAIRLQQFMCNVMDNRFKIFVFTNREDISNVCRDIRKLKPVILLVAEGSFCIEKPSHVIVKLCKI